MKPAEKNKLRQVKASELNAKVTKLQDELVRLRLNIAAGKEKNPKKAIQIRHEIAVIKTILSEPGK